MTATTVSPALTANARAHESYEAAVALLMSPAGKAPAGIESAGFNPLVWALYEAALATLIATVQSAIDTASQGDTIQTADGPLVVQWVVRSAALGRSCAVLTEDGRETDLTGWHNVKETGDMVRVERWVDGHRAFHGYVDSVSRLLVQAG